MHRFQLYPIEGRGPHRLTTRLRIQMACLLRNLSLSLDLVHALHPMALQCRRRHKHTYCHLLNRCVLLAQNDVRVNPQLSLAMMGHLLHIIYLHLRLDLIQVTRLR